MVLDFCGVAGRLSAKDSFWIFVEMQIECFNTDFCDIIVVKAPHPKFKITLT